LFLRWDRFVDLVTIVWLGVFVVGELLSEYGPVCDCINLALLPVFAADLMVRYRRVGNLRKFLRKHWLDILIVIPYFRFLRLIRLAKVVKATKITKPVKTVNPQTVLKKLMKYVKFFKKILRFMK